MDGPRGLESQGVTWARVALAQLLGRIAVFVCAFGIVAGSLSRAFDSWSVGRLTGSLSMVTMLGLLLASFILWFSRAAWPGAVTVDAQGVDVRRGGVTRRIAREKLASAYALTRFSRGEVVPSVELELASGDMVSFTVPSDDVARQIVSDLGFGPGQRRIRIALGSPARRLYHPLIGLVAYYVGSIAALPLYFVAGGEGWVHALIGLVSAGVMVAAYYFLRSLLRAPEITVGDDGLVVRRGRKRQVVAGAAITAVEQPSVALPLLLRTTREARAVAIHGSALDFERRTAVAKLAYERFLAPAGPSDQGAHQFARGGRTLEAWRAHLRAQLGDVGYREVASPVDVAAGVLGSARSTKEERIGAALALRVAGEPTQRIRIAASAVADDDLRRALELVAESEDDVAIERALRRLPCAKRRA